MLFNLLELKIKKVLLCNQERLKTVSFPRKQIKGFCERKGMIPECLKYIAT